MFHVKHEIKNLDASVAKKIALPAAHFRLILNSNLRLMLHIQQRAESYCKGVRESYSSQSGDLIAAREKE